MSDIGNKIKEARKRKGISQDQLAELTNINLRTIQRIENNESTPREKTLNLICSVLDLNIAQLLDSEKQIEKKQLVIPAILTLLIFSSSLLKWFSFRATTGNKTVIGKILNTTGWDGSLSVRNIVIYNWLVSICAISIGAILILTILNIIKKDILFITGQLLVILIYIIFYILVSINHSSLQLQYGLFLTIAATVGLSVLYFRMEKHIA
ncbi:helix-turn-helix domain-containing protein [Aestuariivivens insulae]|uniref:helix-turn-helix domain-containing protein n=1 Tax=Aestuariivivens insulae TaxID=1621988 RepID=UPI001F591467|nr:helix-turn-helix transcriptional regulator [Aestuariivivens insulae]